MATTVADHLALVSRDTRDAVENLAKTDLRTEIDSP